MLLQLEWLTRPVRNVAPDLRVEISWGDPTTGPNRSRTYRIADLNSAVGFAVWINRKGCNVYVGSTLKCADAPEKGRLAAGHAALATCLPIDSDEQFAATASRLAAIAKPQLLIVTGRQPEARGQMFIRIKPTSYLAAWETVHERLVKMCGADNGALGRNRLMRLAGTVSYPSPGKINRGYMVEQTSAHFVPAAEVTIPDLLAALPAPPSIKLPPALVSMSARGSAMRTTTPFTLVETALRNLPAAYAVEHGLWLRVGFALFDFDPGRGGLVLWQRFSQGCPEKASETDFEKVWAGFGRPFTGRRITIRWLLSEARQPKFGA